MPGRSVKWSRTGRREEESPNRQPCHSELIEGSQSVEATSQRPTYVAKRSIRDVTWSGIPQFGTGVGRGDPLYAYRTCFGNRWLRKRGIINKYFRSWDRTHTLSHNSPAHYSLRRSERREVAPAYAVRTCFGHRWELATPDRALREAY
ncbi:unnamed protein product, partial [Iphiclides podalirius]